MMPKKKPPPRISKATAKKATAKKATAKKATAKKAAPVPDPAPAPEVVEAEIVQEDEVQDEVTAVAVVETPEAALANLSEEARAEIQDASEMLIGEHSERTRRAYRSDIEQWKKYAENRGFPAYPVSVPALAAYLANLSRKDITYSTISRRMAAIAWWHKVREMDSPTEDVKIRRLMRSIARKIGRQKKQKRAMSADIASKAILHPGCSQRDRAIIGLGVVTGMRRSEICALTWDDVEVFESGVVIRIARSKTDQAGQGAVVGIPFADDDGVICPARDLLAWRDASHSLDGRVFGVCTKTVARVVKRAVQRAGLDPSHYSAHSMRAGLMTTAAEEGVSLAESMNASRHKSFDVAAGYVRVEGALTNAAHQAVVKALGRKNLPGSR